MLPETRLLSTYFHEILVIGMAEHRTERNGKSDGLSLLYRDSILSLSFLTYTMPVEPTAILAAVLATARAINIWLKAKDRKQSIIDDLTRVTQMLCNIIQPLQRPQNSQKLDANILAVLLEIAGVLASTKEHLALWKTKTGSLASFVGCLAPMAVVETLQDDREKLRERISLLTLALQVNSMPGVGPEADETRGDPDLTAVPKRGFIETGNEELRDFWLNSFGDKMFVFDSAIPSAVSSWTNEYLDEHLTNALIRAIDDKDVGIITPNGFAKFVGSRSIREALSNLKNDIGCEAHGDPTSQRTALTENALPVLVWIDDNPGNNTREALRAQQQGIDVVHIPSTAVAKLWVQENYAHLKQLDNARKLRFITDNNRWEQDDWKGEFLNISAGELALRFLRGSGFSCPVLVYCGSSIFRTQYVRKFSCVGSTIKPSICLAFIKELAIGSDSGDYIWQGFRK